MRWERKTERTSMMKKMRYRTCFDVCEKMIERAQIARKGANTNLQVMVVAWSCGYCNISEILQTPCILCYWY